MKNRHTFEATEIDLALSRGINKYFGECRNNIDGFIRTHFLYPGVWKLNKQALGWDLLRAPCNLFWAPIYVVCQLCAWIFSNFGGFKITDQIAVTLRKLPGGIPTKVQRVVAEKITVEILQRPTTVEQVDPLAQYIVDELDQILSPDFETESEHKRMLEQLQSIVADALDQYAMTRTASADITNSVMSTALGFFAFQKFTPGGIGIGVFLAGYYSYKTAVDNFILGGFLGNIYYTVFPPNPSLTVVSVSIALVLAVLAVIASMSGIITDPIQAKIGFHRYRLNKLVSSLESDLTANIRGSFRPKDQYLARIFDLIDTFKSHSSFL